MEQNIQNRCVHSLSAGSTKISVVSDEKTMGLAAQEVVRDRVKTALDEGKKLVFWLMAAPSGFSWYNAFVEDCKTDKSFGEVIKEAEFFQFDDYRISRNDSRFPVTFRHLLESTFFGPLGDAQPGKDKIHLLELTGNESDKDVILGYKEKLQSYLDDPSAFVIQIKGIGMDGHWGFHGRETPLDYPAEFMEVPINRQNRIQQTLDWPQYFPHLEAVPNTAITASVELFLQADTIIDLVPQRSKLFALLSSYGTDQVVSEIPSSALKNHSDSFSFVTQTAAEALVDFRTTHTVTPGMMEELGKIWQEDEASRLWSQTVLRKLGMI